MRFVPEGAEVLGLDRLHECAGASARFAVTHLAVAEGEERVVPAEAHVAPGVNLRPHLANENRSGGYLLAAEDFYAPALAVAITAVS